jgi:hypothetical protein
LLPMISFFLGILNIKSEIFLVTDFVLFIMSFSLTNVFLCVYLSFCLWKLPKCTGFRCEWFEMLNLVETPVEGVGWRVDCCMCVDFFVVLLVLLCWVPSLCGFFFSRSVCSSSLSSEYSVKSYFVRSRNELGYLLGLFFFWLIAVF